MRLQEDLEARWLESIKWFLILSGEEDLQGSAGFQCARSGNGNFYILSTHSLSRVSFLKSIP